MGGVGVGGVGGVGAGIGGVGGIGGGLGAGAVGGVGGLSGSVGIGGIGGVGGGAVGGAVGVGGGGRPQLAVDATGNVRVVSGGFQCGGRRCRGSVAGLNCGIVGNPRTQRFSRKCFFVLVRAGHRSPLPRVQASLRRRRRRRPDGRQRDNWAQRGAAGAGAQRESRSGDRGFALLDRVQRFSFDESLVTSGRRQFGRRRRGGDPTPSPSRGFLR